MSLGPCLLATPRLLTQAEPLCSPKSRFFNGMSLCLALETCSIPFRIPTRISAPVLLSKLSSAHRTRHWLLHFTTTSFCARTRSFLYSPLPAYLRLVEHFSLVLSKVSSFYLPEPLFVGTIAICPTFQPCPFFRTVTCHRSTTSAIT